MSLLRKRRRDYHGVVHHVDPKRARKRERGERLNKFLNKVYGLIILGVLFWFAYFVFFTSFFMIKEIKVLGHQESESGKIMETVNNFLDSKRYGFLPQKNFFVLDEGGLAWELNDKFILSKLEIEKDFPKKLTIYVREKVSLLNLCVGESCYKVDYFGNIGGRADINNLEEGTPLVYYRLEEEEETEEEPAEDEVEETGEGIVDEIESNPQVKNFPKVIPGATTLSDAKARALIDLFELLREESGGLGIESMDIYSFDGLTERITVNFKGGYKVFFSDEKDLNKQVSDLNTVINNEIRSKTSDIEYIDLRFDKIYYK